MATTKKGDYNMLGRQLKSIALASATRIKREKRYQNHRKEVTAKQIDMDSISYNDTKCINLLVKYLNTEIVSKKVQIIRYGKGYVLLADFRNALLWKVEYKTQGLERVITNIRRY